MGPIPAIIVLIVIFSLIEKFSKAAKRNRNADEPPQRPIQRMPSRPAPPKPDPAVTTPSPAVKVPLDKVADAAQEVALLKSLARPHPTAAAKPTVSAKPAVRMPSGESFTDADGCVGGSLGAHNEEGESRAEHAVHELRRSASMAAEAETTAVVRRIDVKQLRQAVVMAEILDKPKALRARR